MAKYTEAFCVTTGSMISIMQMRSEYNHDPAIYEKVYKGHLFCPGCQAVPLTVVHKSGQGDPRLQSWEELPVHILSIK